MDLQHVGAGAVRRLGWLLFLVPATAGCASGGSSQRLDAGRDAGVSAADVGPSVDAGPHDAGLTDAGPRDAGSRDEGPLDSGPRDAGRDSGPPDAGTDAGARFEIIPGSAPPCDDDLTGGATASSTSVYPGFLSAQAIDDNPATGWYAESGVCLLTATPGIYGCTGGVIRWSVEFPSDRTVSRVSIASDRGYSGYDVLSAELTYVDADGRAIESVVLRHPPVRPPEPDIFVTRTPALPGVRRVDIVVLTADADAPGFGEVEVCNLED